MKISQAVMDIVKRMAERSEMLHRVGAVIVDKRGRIIGEGWNHYEGPNQGVGRKRGSMHAEIHALQKVDIRKLDGAVIYVYRLRSTNLPGLARPCANCMAMIRKLNFAYAVYSNEEGWEIEKII